MTDPATGQRHVVAGRGTSVVVPVLLAVSLVLQCVALYAPQGPGVSPFPLSDKVVHLVIFAVPAVLAVLAGFRLVVVLGVLGAQAVLRVHVGRTERLDQPRPGVPVTPSSIRPTDARRPRLVLFAHATG